MIQLTHYLMMKFHLLKKKIKKISLRYLVLFLSAMLDGQQEDMFPYLVNQMTQDKRLIASMTFGTILILGENFHTLMKWRKKKVKTEKKEDGLRSKIRWKEQGEERKKWLE